MLGLKNSLMNRGLAELGGSLSPFGRNDMDILLLRLLPTLLLLALHFLAVCQSLSLRIRMSCDSLGSNLVSSRLIPLAVAVLLKHCTKSFINFILCVKDTMFRHFFSNNLAPRCDTRSARSAGNIWWRHI